MLRLALAANIYSGEHRYGSGNQRKIRAHWFAQFVERVLPGCCEAAGRSGCESVMNRRSAIWKNSRLKRIRQDYGVRGPPPCRDIATGRRPEAGWCWTLAGDIDILVNNAGGPPSGMWSDWTVKDFNFKALERRTCSPPSRMIKAAGCLRLMRTWAGACCQHLLRNPYWLRQLVFWGLSNSCP